MGALLASAQTWRKEVHKEAEIPCKRVTIARRKVFAYRMYLPQAFREKFVLCSGLFSLSGNMLYGLTNFQLIKKKSLFVCKLSWLNRKFIVPLETCQIECKSFIVSGRFLDCLYFFFRLSEKFPVYLESLVYIMEVSLLGLRFPANLEAFMLIGKLSRLSGKFSKI